MTVNMKGLGRLLAGVVLSIGATATSTLAETTLSLSSWLPPRHPLVVNAVEPWADKVEEVTEGRVTVRVLAKPMGPPPAHFDIAAEGVADIAYGLHSFTTDDRFKRSRIGQFSFIGDDAVAASKAFWNIYSGQLEAQKEHQGVKLLGLFVHGPGVLHSKDRKIEGRADLSGLKIRVPGGYISDLMADLGATTLFMSSSEVYEKLSRGVIDGVTFTYEALTAFKLTNDIKYTMRVPGGFYNTTWFLVMNEAKWNEISPEDQAAIEAISGLAFAELAGIAWNAADEAAKAAINEAGIEVYDAPAPLLEEIKASAAKFEATWAEDVAKDGYDGAAALQALRAETGVEY
ncbi:TRAP transporter substrate-binding protein [Frigidibacter sp. RF13]|uniref:TRAP transporter substrate-binding protein n=1 Tax=Frigidibacter sp. RF13 TaxID=2997340 RepID=UPI00226FACA9|nr:TRAP transporter substrate-binding protein [Frigidibacter sp. RF13]MCY1126505.1 TRAP transporter substrate-binding protein [Frigidibacter sp. RF13]